MATTDTKNVTIEYTNPTGNEDNHVTYPVESKYDFDVGSGGEALGQERKYLSPFREFMRKPYYSQAKSKKIKK